MYKSPIEVLYNGAEMQYENGVVSAVQKYGVNANRDELVRALQYDREQYEKGYADGKTLTEWTPCSERLPEDLEEVNVTWINHIPEPYYDFLKDKPFTGSAVYYRGEWFWYSSVCVDILAEYGTNDKDKVDDGVEITAWMPLPEPWKGEEL